MENFPLFSRHRRRINKGCTQMDDQIMTIAEIAVFLKITEKTTYRLVSEGKIPGFKVGGSWRFNRTEILTWARAKDKKLTDEITI